MTVILDPSELLSLPVRRGGDFTDAIRMVAWDLLFRHASKLTEGKTFQYGDVAVNQEGKTAFRSSTQTYRQHLLDPSFRCRKMTAIHDVNNQVECA